MAKSTHMLHHIQTNFPLLPLNVWEYYCARCLALNFANFYSYFVAVVVIRYLPLFKGLHIPTALTFSTSTDTAKKSWSLPVYIRHAHCFHSWVEINSKIQSFRDSGDQHCDKVIPLLMTNAEITMLCLPIYLSLLIGQNSTITIYWVFASHCSLPRRDCPNKESTHSCKLPVNDILK